MIESECAIRPVLVCNHRHPPYAIAANRSPFSVALDWTGTGDDARIADGSEAVKWAEFGGVMDASHRIEAGEPHHAPGAL